MTKDDLFVFHELVEKNAKKLLKKALEQEKKCGKLNEKMEKSLDDLMEIDGILTSSSLISCPSCGKEIRVYIDEVIDTKKMLEKLEKVTKE